MTFKNILVDVNTSELSEMRLEVAARLAQAHNAHLIGLYIFPRVQVPVYAGAAFPADLFEERERRAEVDSEKAKARFDQVADRSGVQSEWRTERANHAVALNLHAHYADLVVLSQYDPTDFDRLVPSSADYVLLECSRPVLVVPGCGWSDAIGARVLIAWDGGREVARAVHDGMPLLGSATDVCVLSVSPESAEKPDDANSNQAIREHLARHQILTRAENVVASDGAVADVILSTAEAMKADLIVMGAYGHYRLREIFLGSTTRDVLYDTIRPVIVSH